MPRRLTKYGEGCSIGLQRAGVGLLGGLNLRNNFGAEQSGHGIDRLERRSGRIGRPRHGAAEDLAAVVAGHTHGCYFARADIGVEVGGAIDFRTTIAEKDGAFGVPRKLREKLLVKRNDLMRLATDCGDFAGDRNVLAFMIGTTEGVTRQSALGGLLPSHDHAGVQTAGEGHAHAFVALEVLRKLARVDFFELLIIGFGIDARLILPFLWREVRVLLAQRSRSENPGGGGRKDGDAFEEGTILHNTAAGDELAHATRVHATKFRTYGENGFGFGSKIKGFFRLVIVEALQTVAIVEESDGAFGAVDQEAVETSIQTGGKSLILLIKVNEIGGAIEREAMAFFLQALRGTWLRKFFAGKNE